jgi:arylsulfatase A-like enzyme/tetratricopeptide (TPR) repeat protein
MSRADATAATAVQGLRASITIAAAALVAVTGITAIGCRQPAPETQRFPNAPVILISIDTLRSDRLPDYGYDGVETPAISALRQDSILFERAYSHYPLTLPSHTSILTGLLPGQHGVRDNLGYSFDPAGKPYLPLLLHEHGYATGAAVSAFVLNGATGLSAGFDHYDDAIETGRAAALGAVQRPGSATLDATLPWLDTVSEQPFFLFFHIYEPHTPYEPEEPFASRYADHYDGEVATADAVIGRLIGELKRRGLYDDSLVILLSDHGEGLGEHGEGEHGVLLYREVLQVPLLVKLPGSALAGVSTATSAQLVDIVPTVLDLVGIERPAGLAGTSLLALLAPDAAERPIYAESWYARLHMGWSELTSLVQDDRHLIQGPEPELFDLTADPRELDNILEGERRTYARLRGALAALEVPLTAPGKVDPETAARLSALGYVASSAKVGDGPLPDPRSKIGVLQQLGRANALNEQQRWGDAVELLRGLLAENPQMQDGWLTLGHALEQEGRLAESVDAYQQAIDLSGPLPYLTLRLAALYLDLGQLGAAEDHARLALAAKPARAYQQLAEISLARGDLAAAEEQARQAVTDRGTMTTPLIDLARILSRRNKTDEARQALATAERELAERSEQEELPWLHFVRADLAAREGDGGRAIQEFEAEIRLFPENLDAYARLAFLYAVEGRVDLLQRTLQQLVEANRTPAAYAAAVTTLRTLGDTASATRLRARALQLFPDSEQLQAL